MKWPKFSILGISQKILDEKRTSKFENWDKKDRNLPINFEMKQN
jgi:hypothetical protein